MTIQESLEQLNQSERKNDESIRAYNARTQDGNLRFYLDQVQHVLKTIRIDLDMLEQYWESIDHWAKGDR